ncbi:MAG: RNA polymerase factor sigma-54, partial [Gammaproteobacteria bacterium]
MKQSLQLRIGQNLTMTPQLQQAIRLLQLSTLELQTEVQNALDSNPMLEQEEGDQPETSGPASGSDAEDRDTRLNADSKAEHIPDEMPTDSNWEDVFDTGATNYSAPEPGSTRDPLDTYMLSGEGLHE